MGTTRTYKPQVNHSRVITEERTFNGGMQYTNACVGEGRAKLIVNMRPDKASGALSALPAPKYISNDGNFDKHGNYDYQCAAAGILDIQGTKKYTYVYFPTRNLDNWVTRRPCFSSEYIAIVQYDTKPHISLVNTADSFEDSEASEEELAALYVPMDIPQFWVKDKGKTVTIDDLYYESEMVYGTFPTVFIMAGKLFVYVRSDYEGELDEEHEQLEGLYVFNTTTNKFSAVTPKDISVGNVITMGYNMLKPEPYTFSNTTGQNLQLKGVLAYDVNTGAPVVAMRANDTVTFKLVYEYDDEDSNLKVVWKIQDNASSKDPELLQPLKKSPEYARGDAISFTCTVPYSNFTIIAELYDTASIAREEAAWDEDENLQRLVLKEDYHTPEDTITLTNSYVADTTNLTARPNTPDDYNVAHPAGVCVWTRRTVSWGYEESTYGGDKIGGKNIIIISDVDDPSYLPYPNNCLVFDEDIRACTVYRDNLIVFTTGSVYKVAFSDDGITPIQTLIQTGLRLDNLNTADVVSDNNFVMVRTNASYSMLCPSQYTASGLQVAPISDQLGDFCYEFSDVVDNIATAMYPMIKDTEVPFLKSFSGITAKYGIIGHVLSTVPAQNLFVDTFKICMQPNNYNRWEQTGYENLRYSPAWLDVMLCYDTKNRTWSIRARKSSEAWARLVVDTDLSTHHLTIEDGHWVEEDRTVKQFGSASGYVRTICTTEEIDWNPLTEDDDSVCMRSFWRTDWPGGTSDHWNSNTDAFAYLDTGNIADRASLDMKRFREVQYVLCPSKDLDIHVAFGFLVDGKLRKNLVAPHVSRNESGIIDVVTEYDDPYDSDVGNLGEFVLGTDRLCNSDRYLIRHNVSGKGITASTRIVFKMDGQYSIVGVNYVYRPMYSR